MKIVYKADRDKEAIIRTGVAFTLLALLIASVISGNSMAADAAANTKEASGFFGFIFTYLSKNPFVFLFLCLAVGYPLGWITVKGTLVVGVLLALGAFAIYDLKIDAPGLVSDIFLMMFMYAIGMKVGPQFFSGLARGGMDFVVIGLIVVFSNFAIVVAGTKMLEMAPGYAAGIISGSYTVTAVIGVAQSAVSSGAFKLPDGITADQVGANIAAGYAISYILSSVFIILLIKYLPSMFGIDPVKAGKDAEAEFGAGGENAALPSTAGFSKLGVMPMDIRAYKVEHDELVGKTVEELFRKYPRAAVLKVVRGDEVLDASDNPTIQMGDVIGVRGHYDGLIARGEKVVGAEVDEPRARDVEIQVADVIVGKSDFAGKSLQELGETIGFGVNLKAMFRSGNELPHLPETIVEVGDVLRLAGSEFCVEHAAKKLNSKPIVESTVTETFYLAVSLLIGYVCGKLSVTLGGIPFALGTSAGCMLTGIMFSYLRTRNPAFGGPMSEGARSFVQDIGLSVFVAVLASSVGPKILASFQGTVVIKIAALGLIAALVPPFLAWLYGMFRKMNPVILAGACAGGRNSTPAMKGISDQSQSDMPAIGYPVPYALTSMIVLILGYIAMVIS
jgi:putative transport protein